jgi:hypothetical protein
MNLFWGVMTILLVLGIAALAIILCIGTVALFIVSIVEYIEKKLNIITIGEQEENLIAEAEKLREEQRRTIKGPWTLTPKVKPYSSKVFQFLRAKETLEKK